MRRPWTGGPQEAVYCGCRGIGGRELENQGTRFRVMSERKAAQDTREGSGVS